MPDLDYDGMRLAWSLVAAALQSDDDDLDAAAHELLADLDRAALVNLAATQASLAVFLLTDTAELRHDAVLAKVRETLVNLATKAT